jgi:hypothetical protein
MLADPERHIERAVFHEAPQGIPSLGVASQQIHCLGEHRFTHEKRRLQFLDALDRPAMVAFRPVEKRDPWTVSTMTGIAAEA